MIIKCGDKHRTILNECLKEECVYNTFLIADISRYGFHHDFQDVWMDLEQEQCVAVYLRFYNNLLIYSKNNQVNHEFIDDVLRNNEILVIMGKKTTLQMINDRYAGDYKNSDKYMCVLDNDSQLIEDEGTVKTAVFADVDDIHSFLMRIKQFKNMYASKAMIEDRIKKNDGKHVFIAVNGRIVSHGNSTASSDHAVMIGGIATDPEHRRRNYASKIVSKLARNPLALNKKMCALCEDNRTLFLFEKLGFIKMGKWSVMEKI